MKLGAPRRKGVTVDLAVFAKDLALHLDPLATALEDVTREAREGQATLAAKSNAMDANDRDFQRIGALTEALARFVGLADIAAKARPSARRPGGPASEEETAPPDGTPTPMTTG